MVHWLAVAFAGVLAVQAAQVQHLKGVYIVQYEDDHDPSTVLDDIRRKHDLEVRKEFNFKLFKGADVFFPDSEKAGSAAAELRAMSGVKNVWQSRLFPRAEVTLRSTGNGEMHNGAIKRDVQHDKFSPHVSTQVNMLRDAGYVGKGFKMALVDTGVDYMHPALGAGFGPGHVVSFGTDLVGDDYNGSNTPVPDPDPMGCGWGHGTHTAGIIAAQPDKNPYGITGAAAGVNLGVYRVFGCEGSTTEGVLIDAYHRAFEDGVDLIHASIGGESGWPENAWDATVATIVAHGVPCTFSAGNHGPHGLFYGQHAADAIGAAAVGSTENVVAPSLQVNATYSVDGGASVSFGFSPGIPRERWTAKKLSLWTPITNISDITNQDFGCDPYPDTTPNLSGCIVLVPRGFCPVEQKAKNAARWGAKNIMAYNYVPGTFDLHNTTEVGTSFGMVSQDQGVEWVKLLLSGAKVDVDMVDVATAPVLLVNTNNTQAGGYVSTGTSWGPTWELAIKPQFVAPGGDILSLWPRDQGGYAVLSGTSMSGPLVAAMYVLLMETTGVRDPGLLGRLLSSTAKQLDYNDGLKTRVGMPAPVPQQGAGVTQVFDASRTRTVFDVDSLAFNDTDHFIAERNFTIFNLGNDTLQYRLDHTPALTAYTFDNDSSLAPSITSGEYAQPNVVPNELVGGHATLDFFFPSHDGANSTDSPDSFSIPAHQKRVVSVRVTRPTGLDDGRMPVWSGWIRLTVGNNASKLSLPYQGLTGSLHNRTVLDVKATGLAGSQNPDVLLLGPRTFLLPPAGKANLTRWSLAKDAEMPTVVVNLALGSLLVRADLIPVGVTGTKLNLTTILGTNTAGSLSGWPVTERIRGPSTYWDDAVKNWDGQLADGGYAPEGVYKINIKALRIFGDPDKREDYDEFETLKFAIRYAEDM